MMLFNRSRIVLAVIVLVMLASGACKPQGDELGRDGGTKQAPASSTSSSENQPEPAAEETEIFVTCMNFTPNPLGISIAETYELPYKDVASWYCEGFSYENIMIALETSEAVDIPADALLQMLLEKDWEEIWVDIGFTGK